MTAAATPAAVGADALDALRARVRAFVDERVIPLEAALDAARAHPDAPFPAQLEHLREQAREAGLWNLFLRGDARGAGLTQAQYAVVCEEMGRSIPAPHAFNCAPPDTGNAELLHAYGSDAQRARFLDPLLAGATRSCFAMTEPGVAGSDPAAIATRAVQDADGGWTIDGRKWFTTGARGAAFLIVMAVTDPDAPRHERATLFLLPLPHAGVEIVRSLPILGHDGFPGHCEVRFDRCRVPADAILGRRGQGFAVAQARLGPGRLHHCMRAIGNAERALELLCERARTRGLRGGTLADRQLVQEAVARSRTEIDAARMLVRHAAARMDAVGAAAAAKEISIAKLSAPQTAQRVVDRAIQVHGALGVTDDTPLAALAREVRTLRLVDGTDEVHLVVVARAELAAGAARADATAGTAADAHPDRRAVA